jgi:hypothetical protein
VTLSKVQKGATAAGCAGRYERRLSVRFLPMANVGLGVLSCRRDQRSRADKPPFSPILPDGSDAPRADVRRTASLTAGFD